MLFKITVKTAQVDLLDKHPVNKTVMISGVEMPYLIIAVFVIMIKGMIANKTVMVIGVVLQSLIIAINVLMEIQIKYLVSKTVMGIGAVLPLNMKLELPFILLID